MADEASTTANSEVSFSLAPDGLAISAKGSSADRLGHILANAISPFSSALGWVGDQLTIKRQAAALRAAMQAREQLNREGITHANIPPRILLPWLEGSSLEEDDRLTSAWAGLFVRAVKSADAAMRSYMETLKRIGSDEAGLLEFFATDTSPFYSQKFYTSGERNWGGEDPFGPLFQKALDHVVDEDHVQDMRNDMDNILIQFMCQVIFFSTPKHKMVPTPHFILHEHAIANLEHLGLIKVNRCPYATKIGEVEIVWFELTKYAFDFIWACKGVATGLRAAQKDGSYKSRYGE